MTDVFWFLVPANPLADAGALLPSDALAAAVERASSAAIRLSIAANIPAGKLRTSWWAWTGCAPIRLGSW